MSITPQAPRSGSHPPGPCFPSCKAGGFDWRWPSRHRQSVFESCVPEPFLNCASFIHFEVDISVVFSIVSELCSRDQYFSILFFRWDNSNQLSFMCSFSLLPAQPFSDFFFCLSYHTFEFLFSSLFNIISISLLISFIWWALVLLFSFHLFFSNYIYLVVAVLGLHCRVDFSLVAVSRGLFSGSDVQASHCGGFSWAQAQ